MKLALLLSLCSIPAAAQISCPNGFNTTVGNQCYVLSYGPGATPANYWERIGYTAQLNGTEFNLQNASTSGHTSAALNFGTQVNVQAFTTTFQFIPNGWNIALVFNNSNNNPDFNGVGFVAGAGCEGGFFQAFGGPLPNNVFALMFDQWSSLTAGAANFTYSSVQTYVSGQSPCNPNLNQTPYNSQNKISTSPVPLNSPATTINTTTQDTYSATVTYDGSNLTVNLYDVTKGGACSPSTSSTCFTHTWTGVNIPAAVGSNTAWIGFTSSTNSVVPWNLYLNSFTYTAGTPITTVAAPTFSPVAGTYTSAQTVSMSDATSGAVIYYTTDGSTPTAASMKYSIPLVIGATETLKAVATASGYTNSAIASALYTINLPPPVCTVTGLPNGSTITVTVNQ